MDEVTVGDLPAGRDRLDLRLRRAPTATLTASQADMFEQLPVAVITADLDGTITRWNRYAEELFGWKATDVLGRPGRQVLAFATDRQRADSIIEGLRQGIRWDGELTVRRRDRSTMSVYVTTSPLHEPDGGRDGILAVAVDITPRVRAERERAEALRREQAARAEAELLHRIATAASAEEDLGGILSAALDRLGRLIPFTGGSIALVDGDDLVLRAGIGPFASGVVGQRLPRGSGQSWRVIETGEPWMTDDLVEEGFHIRGVPPEEGPRSYLAVPLTWRGQTVGLLQVDSVHTRAFRPDDRSLLEAVAVALSGPIEVARRREAERDALEESRQAEARLALIAQASEILGSSLDYPETLAAVARLAIPRLADYSIVAVLEDEGGLRQVAVAHRDPAKEESLRELRRRYPFDPAAPFGSPHVVATGKPEIQNDIDEAWLAGVARDPEHRRLIEEFHFSSYMIVPLVARGRTVGTFSFVSTDPARRYGQADLSLAEDLGRRAAAAVDVAQLYRTSQESRALLGTLFESAPVGMGYWDRELRFVRLNHALAEMNGLPIEELIGRRIEEIQPEMPPGALEAFRQVLDTGQPLIDLEVSGDARGEPGGRRHWLASYYPVRDVDGEILGLGAVVIDISERKRAEEERTRLLEQEQRARAETETARMRLSVLADATRVLAASLDYETTLRHVTEVAVPAVADWCIVDIVEEGGTIRRLAATYGASADPELADELLRRSLPPPLDADTPLGQVIRSGEALHLREIPDEMLRAAATDEEHFEMLRRLGLQSALIVPLTARGRSLGAITLISTGPDHRYDEADLLFALDLARRAGAAIDTARLTTELADFRTTVDLTHDGVLMFDPETLRYFYANEGAVELTGYQRDELLEMTPLDLKPDFDEERLRTVLAPLLAGSRESTVMTTTQRRKDGRLISVEMLMQHVRPEAERARVVTIVRDISDRIDARARLQRLAESERARNAELRAIIRAMGDAVMVVQRDGTISMTNPAADELFPSVVGRYEELLAYFEDLDGRAPVIGDRARAGPVEIRLTGQDERWLEVSAYPVFTPTEALPEDEDERVLETILFMRDVTEQRRARETRDAFIGVLSHELRTPVTTIYGNSKLLGRTERALDEDTKREVFTDIELESERLYRLVEDLLVLARFGEGEARLGREPLLLQRLVPIVVRSERPRWPSTTFTTEIAPGIPTVQGDPTYVEQVIRNLIGNAAKYGGDNGEVRIILEAMAPEVALRVLDDGPGFSPEETTQLFALFYRSPSTATKASGAGIGLFVCKRLIEEMGGRIWAHPRPEGGAEFGFTLPVFNEESE